MKKLTKPEILAPAGSMEAFFAAMEAGADAVYCGLQTFSARAKAKNFALPDLERVLTYAHSLDRKLFVTLNTLVKEEELPQLVETLAALEAMKVDAVIIQDLAIWRLVRDHFPSLPLHASTQMTVHNAAGVRQLERMGFERAVLAREMTLDEISSLRNQTSLDLEHFVQGALCFSFSGQCYFSSFLGGRSGNRGRCAQPCRRSYRYRQKEGYYFSPNDLSAIDLLDQLSDAGVMSFKIEGRMKSAEYVSNVVRAYRQVLDAPAAQRKNAIREAKELLKGSFGRQPTHGFLAGTNPADIATPSRKGSTGRYLGEVNSVRAGEIFFRTGDRLHVGDRLRIQPKSDRAGTAFTIKKINQNRKPVKKVAAGAHVGVPSPFRDNFRNGDAVFKVSSEQAFNMSDAACRRKLTRVSATHPLTLSIELEDDSLSLQGEAAGVSLQRSYDVTTEKASKNPLSIDTLKSVFEKTAGEPLSLSELTCGDLPRVAIAPSRLKEIRRQFYRDLASQVQGEAQSRRRRHRDRAMASLLPQQPAAKAQRRHVTLAIRDLRDVHILSDADVDRVLVPFTPGNVQEALRLDRRLEGKKEHIVWDLPFILFDPDWQHYLDGVKALARQGYLTFRLNNIGHLPLFDGVEGATLLTGYRLFSLNSQAVLAWKELGAHEMTLYLEDDRDNLGQILQRDTGVEAALTVYGPVPLITSRIPLRSLRPDTPLLSDRGDRYRVAGRGGLTVLTSETDFSLLGLLNEVDSLGCRRLIVDLTHCGPFSAKGKTVRDALSHNKSISGTSVFNFEKGIE